MSVQVTQSDGETGRSSSRTTSQARLRSDACVEGTHKSCSGPNDVEPTEVIFLSQKTTHGRSSERSQLKLSKLRSHVASSHRSAEHVSSYSHGTVSSRTKTPRNGLTDAAEYPISQQNSFAGTVDSERTKFLGSIPRMPSPFSANDQFSSRDERAGHTPFPPPQSPDYGPNLSYSSTSSSDVRRLPRDSNESCDLPFRKRLTDKHSKGLRVKGQAEAEMQRNVMSGTPHCSHPKESVDSRVSPKYQEDCQTSKFYYPRAGSLVREGRIADLSRSKEHQTESSRFEIGGSGGGKVYYESTQLQRPSNRVSITTRGRSGVRYNGSGTDGSQITSSGSEDDISSSTDFIKRRRRVKRKVSAKSIGSSMYGEDNTSEESEATNCTEGLSDLCSKSSRRSGRTLNAGPEDCFHSASHIDKYGSQDSEFRRGIIPPQNISKLRSSSLTSVSSLEGLGFTGFRTSSPLQSPSVARVSKIQINSFAAATASRPSNEENQPRRRSSLDEGKFASKRDRSESETSHKTNVESSSPNQQLSKSPFSLKAKPFGLRGRLSRGNSLASDSDTSVTSPSLENSGLVSRETSNESPTVTSATSNCIGIDKNIEESHSLQEENSFGSESSAFESVKPCNRSRSPVRRECLEANHYEDEPPISDYSMVTEESTSLLQPAYDIQDGNLETKLNDSLDGQTPSSLSVLSAPVSEPFSDIGHRPLSIVCEQDEYTDVSEAHMLHRDKYRKESLEHNKLHRSSPVITSRTFPVSPKTCHHDTYEYERKSVVSSTPGDVDTSASTLRRPSYVQAQRNSEIFHPLESVSDTGRSSVYTDPNLKAGPCAIKTVPECDSADDPYEVLKSFSGSEFGKQETISSKVAEGDLISFDDEQKEEETPRKGGSVKKRNKRMTRPKIPTILSYEDVEKLHAEDEDETREGRAGDGKEFEEDFIDTVVDDNNDKGKLMLAIGISILLFSNKLFFSTCNAFCHWKLCASAKFSHAQ